MRDALRNESPGAPDIAEELEAFIQSNATEGPDVLQMEQPPEGKRLGQAEILSYDSPYVRAVSSRSFAAGADPVTE